MISVGSAYALVEAKFYFASASRRLAFSLDVGRAYAQQNSRQQKSAKFSTLNSQLSTLLEQCHKFFARFGLLEIAGKIGCGGQ